MAKTQKVGGFEFDMGLEVPAVSRDTAPSEDAQKMEAMPVGASFLVPVSVPDTLKSPAEREKALAEGQRKVMNRLSGTKRRVVNKHAERNFVVRKVNDEKQGQGVRVYREADSAPETDKAE